jgi:hypothetical protein
MPLYTLTNEHEYTEIIVEQRVNLIVFTVDWSLGSKMMLAKLFDLSYEKKFIHTNIYRIDLNDRNSDLAQHLNIVSCNRCCQIIVLLCSSR